MIGRAIAYEKIKLRDKNEKAWYNEKKEETRGKIPWGNGIVEILKEIPDYRVGNAKKHRLEEILTIAVLSVLSDCTRWSCSAKNKKNG